MKPKDEFVRLRKLLEYKHRATDRGVLKLSKDLMLEVVKEKYDEMLRKQGEKRGLCFAMKALDKACQTTMDLG